MASELPRALSGRSAGRVCAALFALTISSAHSAAHAHAPIVRGAAFEEPGTASLVALPGFGVLIGQADGTFAYACDALMRTEPSEDPISVLYRADGTRLIGNASGLRRLDARGCPIDTSMNALASIPVLALAEGSVPNRLYAATGGDLPALRRSDDGGETWVVRAQLSNLQRVTDLSVAGEPERVYVSVVSSDKSSTVRVWSEDTSTFSDVPQTFSLRLLRPKSQSSSVHWGVRRADNGSPNQGFEIVRSAELTGPWDTRLTVNYFASLVFAPDGSMWVGDESRGVHHSTDGGETFVNVADLGVSCVVAAQGTIWACKLSLPQEPGFFRMNTAGVFEPAFSLSSVDEMVDCGPEIDVPRVCAAAWVEWRRDVLLMPVSFDDAGVDAGSAPVDAGPPNEPADASTSVDAALDAGASDVAPSKRGDGGCSAPGATGRGSCPWLLAALAFAVGRRRRR